MLAMDHAAIAAFLTAQFPQVSGIFAVDSVSVAELSLRLTPGLAHLRPGGTVSGPTLFALADVAMYLAILSRIGPRALAVTTNCSIDFMRRPAADMPLIGTAQVLKLGRRLAVGSVLIAPAGSPDLPVARAGLTYSIPPG